MMQEMVRFWGGSGISWTICKQSVSCSRQIITPMCRHHHSICFALPDAQPTASKHWRHWVQTRGVPDELGFPDVLLEVGQFLGVGGMLTHELRDERVIASERQVAAYHRVGWRRRRRRRRRLQLHDSVADPCGGEVDGGDRPPLSPRGPKILLNASENKYSDRKRIFIFWYSRKRF